MVEGKLMSYKNLIDSNLRRAFILVRDLAEDVTFNLKEVIDFDFSTGNVVENPQTTVIVKAVVITSKKESRDVKGSRNTDSVELMFSTRDVGDLTMYDTVIIAGNEWNLGKRIKSDGYITLVELYREA